MKGPSESITDEQLEILIREYGFVWASAKLDGFRCVCDNGQAKTSSMKPIKNKYTQSILSQPEYDGLDGEIVVGNPEDPDAFANTKGAITKIEGEPDFKLYVFDMFLDTNLPYEQRVEGLPKICKALPFAVYIKHIKITSLADFITFENNCVDRGCEGAMINVPGKKYKEGRATFNDPICFKRKPLEDAEAIIVGFEEQMQNNNKKTTNELGHSVRSSHKENKTGKATLGAIILKDDKHWKKTFKLAVLKGVTAEKRKEIWDNRENLLGGIVTYTFQRHGSVDAPRIPKCKDFLRDLDTMTDY